MTDKTTKEYKVQYFVPIPSKKADWEAHLYGKNGKIEDKTYGKNGNYFYLSSCTKGKGQNNIDVFCLRKVRKDGIPDKINLDSKKEARLGLGPREGLSEKAYMAYHKKAGIVFQCNGNVCHAAAFPSILEGIFRETYITPLSLNRNLLSRDKVAVIDITAAMPQGANAISRKNINSNGFAFGISEIANALGPDSEHSIRVIVNLGRGKNKKTHVSGKLINSLSQWLGEIKGKVWVKNEEEVFVKSDDDDVHPGYLMLNLTGTAKTSLIKVKMDDKYPNEADIIAKLQKCLVD